MYQVKITEVKTDGTMETNNFYFEDLERAIRFFFHKEDYKINTMSQYDTCQITLKYQFNGRIILRDYMYVNNGEVHVIEY